MSPDLELIDHIDKKFKESREERAATARDLHDKIDALAAENRLAHAAVVNRVTLVEVKLDGHLKEHNESDDRTQGWFKIGAAGAIGGFSTWLAKYFGIGGQH